MRKRVAWAERWHREGWELLFTPAGGRLRNDALAALPANIRSRAERIVSQAAFAITTDGPSLEPEPRVALWAAVCRKVLQRGERPLVPRRVDEIINGIIGTTDASRDPAESQGRTLRALASGPTAPLLDPSYELDPAYELPLWRLVESRAPGMTRWLHPQVPLDALVTNAHEVPRGSQWVDFLYSPPWLTKAIVVELDGRTSHGRERVMVDADRDQRAWAAGLAVRRFAGPDAIDPSAALLTGIGRDHERWLGGEPADRATRLALHGGAVVTRLGLAIVEAVVRGLLRPGRPWVIDIADELDIAQELIGPALDLLRAISEIWDARVVPDEVLVDDAQWAVAPGDHANRPPSRRRQADLRVVLEPTHPYWEALPTGSSVPQVVIRGVGVPVDLAWLPASHPVRVTVPKRANVNDAIHLLLADVFGFDEFRDGQLGAIRQILSGSDCVALLPTGSGKTLIFQMAGLLLPGSTLVVDPLVSLIDDQTERLARDGIDRAAGLHQSNMARPGARDASLDAVASGDALFTFVSPERLQNGRFREALARASREQTIPLAVVDESHCVSEWGHDFRTSYLHVGALLRRLCADEHGAPPVLAALTGTASPGVLRDTLRELEIDGDREGALQRPSSHDRPNLTYIVRSGPEARWREMALDAVTDLVPQYLDAPVEALGEPNGPATCSGLVFTPHVRGEHGIESVRAAVVERLAAHGVRAEAEVYAGQDPGAASEHDWDRRRAEAAARFKGNDVPILVATKAFGMGIDKPNIRYTVHAGMPSSIEAFAQEAGRAGRDGQPAVCILTGVVPGPAARAVLTDLSLKPRERLIRLSRDRRDDDDPGDLRRQAWFLTNSFPGEVEELAKGSEVVQLLARELGWGGGRVSIPRPHRRQGDREERRRTETERQAQDRALYRLALLGVVRDITTGGGAITIDVAAYDRASVQVSFLQYAKRLEPGQEVRHLELAQQAPDEPMAHVLGLLDQIIQIVYRVVLAARLYALSSIADLVARAPESDVVRSQINAYLGSGPAANVLTEAVLSGTVNVQRFIRSFRSLGAVDRDEIGAQAARQLESYPDHPMLLLASAVGETRVAAGDQSRFRTSLAHAIRQLHEYRVEPDDAASAVRWVAGLLLREARGRNRLWLRELFEAWDASPYARDPLGEVEDAIIEEARRGAPPDSVLESVAARRVRRHARDAVSLADTLVGVSHGSQGVER